MGRDKTLAGNCSNTIFHKAAPTKGTFWAQKILQWIVNLHTGLVHTPEKEIDEAHGNLKGPVVMRGFPSQLHLPSPGNRRCSIERS